MFTKIVNDGESIPKGYGVFYYDYSTHKVVCSILGLNRILRPIRSIYLAILFFFKCPGFDWIDKAFNESTTKNYKMGYSQGFYSGFKECSIRVQDIRKCLNLYKTCDSDSEARKYLDQIIELCKLDEVEISYSEE